MPVSVLTFNLCGRKVFQTSLFVGDSLCLAVHLFLQFPFAKKVALTILQMGN